MRIPKVLFMSLLPVSFLATRRPGRGAFGRSLMRFFGDVTMLLGRARPQTGVEAVGREWQRMFARAEDVPITRVERDTVHAEIHVKCPYRGTGNVEGCFRMMEYDRRMLERIGGQLVVLRSQAEPGVTTCQVAIRTRDAASADLVPAHVRVRDPGSHERSGRLGSRSEEDTR